MTELGFHPRHHVAEPADFLPLITARASAKGFVRHAPSDLLSKPVLPDEEPQETDVASEQADAPQCPGTVAKTLEIAAPDTAALEAEFRRGLAQGRAEVEAVMGAKQAQLEAAASALSDSLSQIGMALEEETVTLAGVLQDAVLALASERAGAAIQKTPTSFAQRITALAERISDSFAQLSVRLNPDDLEQLRALRDPEGLPELERLFTAEMLPDPALSHGDIRLRTAAIALDDLLRSEIGL
ncbi:MAG: hypothetical protein JJU24_02210 [Natronohydrobacter sp.]|nr:hypothetical protein [Natronohydrobacter sp.]